MDLSFRQDLLLLQDRCILCHSKWNRRTKKILQIKGNGLLNCSIYVTKQWDLKFFSSVFLFFTLQLEKRYMHNISTCTIHLYVSPLKSYFLKWSTFRDFFLTQHYWVFKHFLREFFQKSAFFLRKSKSFKNIFQRIFPPLPLSEHEN